MEIVTCNVLEIESKLDNLLLDTSGKIKLLSHKDYQHIDPIEFRVWCNRRARYGIPTIELVEWLKGIIGGRSAIEIGAGNGDLGYHLGIRSTDSYSQQLPEVNLFVKMNGQVPTNPPADVEKLEAIAAIDKYKPEVIIGSWITSCDDGNYLGPDEKIIVDRATYIHVGCHKTHGDKTIRNRSHQVFELPFLVSRTALPIGNAVYIWNCIDC